MSDLAVSTGYVLFVLGLLGVAETLRATFGIRAEVLRKIPHVGAGLLVLVAPLCFGAPRAPLLLSLAFAAFLAAAEGLGLFPATHAVARRTHGTLYFPIATFLVIAACWHEHREAFAIAIGVLALGDGLAGLVGESIGRHAYTVWRNTRTLEGSATMFAVSAVVAGTVLGTLGGIEGRSLVAGALAIAAVATAVEAISPGGSDNLWVPLSAAIATLLVLDGVPVGLPSGIRSLMTTLVDLTARSAG